jgi:serpin B
MAPFSKPLTALTFGLLAALGTACSSSSSSDGPGTSTGTQGGGGHGGAAQAIGEARSEKAFDAKPAAAPADYAALVAGANDLGFDLEKKLGEKDNFIFSPVSAVAALSMTYAGAKGATATQMGAVLHDSLGQDKWAATFNQLVVDLAARNVAEHQTEAGKMSLTLNLVDAAFAQKGYEFVPAYLDTLAVHYDAGVKLVDYEADPEGARSLINAWVATNTKDKIKDLLPEGSIDLTTRLVLANALYFYGSWHAPFEPKSTTKDTFHAPSGDVTADTMHDVRYGAYLEGDGFKATELGYDGGQVVMTIVLPDDGKLADVEGKLSSAWLDATAKGLADPKAGGEVRIALPKFKFTWGTKELGDALQALGMKDAFTNPPADFSGMEPKKELYISHVLQKAFVGVDEYGTEAAAATAVVMSAGGMPEEPKDFTIDRPFLFFVRDTGSGAVLFSGKVVDPTK